MNKIALFLIHYFFFIFAAQSAFSQDSSEFDEDEFSSFESQFSNNEKAQIYDPLEPINRKIFAFNEVVDIYAVDPAVKYYRDYIPKPIRRSVHNFVVNLSLPLSAINSFAQGKLDNGLASFSHFLINSTIGVFGLFDVAGNKNIRYNPEDFGQTLGHYGLGKGPYIVLPLLGPSNLRDFSGRLVDGGIDPMSLNLLEVGGSRDGFVNNEIRISNTIIGVIDTRTELITVIDDARKDSFDLYAKMRSFYSQNRDSNVEK